MAVSLNKVLIAGNLTRDPETKFLANEKCISKFSIASNRKFGDKEEVTFVEVECWGRTAELAGQYLTKGRACLVEGRLRMDQWEDKATGAKRSKLLVVADNIQFLGSPDGGRTESPSRSESPRREDVPAGYDEDLQPF